MKKTVLLALTLIFLFGNQIVLGQESVSETTKFAERCQNKIKKRRFNKLQEYYPKALKDIEKIITKAETDPFGYDNVAKKAPKWIEMMHVLAKFPNNQCAYKDDVITFEITDYKPLLAEAKTKANEAHYQEGVKIMDENKGNFTKRKKACEHFLTAMDFSDNHKEDMLERGAQIHYDEGLRILTEKKDFSGKKYCEEHFEKALKWKKPYKDIDQLMAKLYFDEAERLAATENPENWKKALPYYSKANKWAANYNDCNHKYIALEKKGAEFYYLKGQEAEAKHTYASQQDAAEYYAECKEWVKDYKDAEKRAALAKERSIVRVVYYKAPKFINPNNIKNPLLASEKSNSTEDMAKNSKNWGHFQFPFDKQYNLKQIHPTSSVARAQEMIGGGFILVAITESEEPTYSESPKSVNTEKVTTYTGHLDGEGEKQHLIDHLTYTIGLEANKKTHTGTYRKHTGTVTKTSEGISARTYVMIDIYDMREPGKAKKIRTISKEISAVSTVTNETFEGDPWAKPKSLKTDGPLKTRHQMWEIIEKKTNDSDAVLNAAREEIGEVLKQEVDYYHIEK